MAADKEHDSGFIRGLRYGVFQDRHRRRPDSGRHPRIHISAKLGVRLHAGREPPTECPSIRPASLTPRFAITDQIKQHAQR